MKPECKSEGWLFVDDGHDWFEDMVNGDFFKFCQVCGKGEVHSNYWQGKICTGAPGIWPVTWKEYKAYIRECKKDERDRIRADEDHRRSNLRGMKV